MMIKKIWISGQVLPRSPTVYGKTWIVNKTIIKILGKNNNLPQIKKNHFLPRQISDKPVITKPNSKVSNFLIDNNSFFNIVKGKRADHQKKVIHPANELNNSLDNIQTSAKPKTVHCERLKEIASKIHMLIQMNLMTM